MLGKPKLAKYTTVTGIVKTETLSNPLMTEITPK